MGFPISESKPRWVYVAIALQKVHDWATKLAEFKEGAISWEQALRRSFVMMGYQNEQEADAEAGQWMKAALEAAQIIRSDKA